MSSITLTKATTPRGQGGAVKSHTRQAIESLLQSKGELTMAEIITLSGAGEREAQKVITYLRGLGLVSTRPVFNHQQHAKCYRWVCSNKVSAMSRSKVTNNNPFGGWQRYDSRAELGDPAHIQAQGRAADQHSYPSVINGRRVWPDGRVEVIA
jgi:hypothetical protein